MPDVTAVGFANRANTAGGVRSTVPDARFPGITVREGPNGSPIERRVRVAVVIPTNRPDEYDKWFDAWRPYLEGINLYVVRDCQETWDRIDALLGRDAWIIPRQTDCIRSFGYLQAYHDGADIIITLDDDCYPQPGEDPLREHVQALTTLVEPLGWGRTLPDLATRGLPEARHVVINHGLWSEIPDVSGRTQLRGYHKPLLPRETLLTPGLHYPLSGMNLSWRRSMMPAMYFGLMGSKPDGTPWGVQRYGDIWCGLFAKRIADYNRDAIRSGTPFVRHIRASDPVKNAEQEKAGEFWTPELTRMIDSAPDPPRNRHIEGHARILADRLMQSWSPYWVTYGRAWHIWQDLLHADAVFRKEPSFMLTGVR